MTQERYINFGHPADASGIKTINQQFFAPAVLRANEPLLQAVAPDQVLINPHSCVFVDGIVLVETEIHPVTIDTSPASANYTIYYTHEDEDLVGGVAALLHTDSGIKQSVENGVILGWVIYPGGSVQVDDTMLIPNWFSQVQPGGQYKEIVRVPADSLTVAKLLVTEPAPGYLAMLGQTIPATPHQILLTTGLLVSKLLAINLSRFRVYSHDDGADMTRVSGAPSASGEYNVNTTTGLVTFHVLDEGKAVDLSDFTYGPSARLSINDTGSGKIVDEVYEFGTFDEPIRSIFVEYAILASGFTVDPVEILDADGDEATWIVEKDEPVTPDGLVSRLKIRILTGTMTGNGSQILVRLRKSLAAAAEGVVIKVRASVYDLPF